LLSYRHSRIRKVYYLTLKDSKGFGLLLSLFWNIFEIIAIFAKEKPSILFSTGSEIAIVPFYLGKLFFRAKLIFLETATRVYNLSFTAKVLYPICDLFLVQWETLLKKAGRRAQLWGRVI